RSSDLFHADSERHPACFIHRAAGAAVFQPPTSNPGVLPSSRLSPMIEITIQNERIGPAHPPLVIAEIGINHAGSLLTAKAMVDEIGRAGVEVVKHQTHIVEDEMSAAAKRVVPGNADVDRKSVV